MGFDDSLPYRAEGGAPTGQRSHRVALHMTRFGRGLTALRYGLHMQMSFWRLGLNNAWRDWRAGELRLLVVAIALAVAALTAVGFFATGCAKVLSVTPGSCSVGMRCSAAIVRPLRPL